MTLILTWIESLHQTRYGTAMGTMQSQHASLAETIDPYQLGRRDTGLVVGNQGADAARAKPLFGPVWHTRGSGGALAAGR
jgi:hypothetical protein